MDLLLPITVPRRQPWQYQVAEDDLPGATNFYREQEEGWFWRPSTQSVPWAASCVHWQASPNAFQEDMYNGSLVNFYREQEEGWKPPAVESVPWLPLPFADEHASEPLKYFYLEQEEFWHPPEREVVPWLVSPKDPALPSPFVEDGEFTTPPFTSGVGLRAWTSGDVNNPTSPFDIVIPAGVQPTDVLVLVMSARCLQFAGYPTLAPANGSSWTPNQVGSEVQNNPFNENLTLDVWWNRGSTTDTSFTVGNITPTGAVGWVCLAFYGAAQDAPIGSVGAGSSNAQNATLTVNSVTGTANAIELVAAASWDFGAFSIPGFYDRQNGEPNAVGTSVAALQGASVLTPADTGTLTLTASNVAADQNLLAMPFVLRASTSGYMEQEEGWFWRPLQEVVDWQARTFLDEHASEPLKYFYLEQEEYFIPRSWVVFTSPAATVDDDVFVVTTATPDDECNPYQSSFPTISYLAPPSVVDEDGANLTFFYREQEDYFPPQQEVVPWLSVPFLDEHTSEPLAYFYLEDDPPYTSRDEVFNWYACVYLGGDTATFLSPTPDDEANWTAQVEAAVWTSQPFTDDEIGSPLAFFYRDQEEFWTAAVQTTVQFPLPFTNDETRPVTTAPTLDQEEPFWGGVPPVTMTSWFPLPFTDDDVGEPLVFFYREQEDDYNRQVQQVPWTAFVAADEHSSEPLVYFYTEQEEFWTAQCQSVPWSSLLFTDEAARPTPPVFFLDQEEFWTAQYESVPWQSVTFLDEHASEPLTYFPLEQEEFWTAQYESVPWQPITFLDEHASEPLAYFGLEDESFFPPGTENVVWLSLPSLTGIGSAEAFVVSTVYRKTRSSLGTRTGSRQRG